MDKKGVMSISLVLLFLFILIVIGIVISIFISSDKKVTYVFQETNEVDHINNEVLNLNFYLEELFYRTTNGASNINSEIFIQKYKENLDTYNPYAINKYKDQILSNLNNENIIIGDNKISFKVNLVLRSTREDNTIDVSYDYKKTFEKNLG
jgi:hypothetical protein